MSAPVILVSTPQDHDAQVWLAGLHTAFPASSIRAWIPGDDAPADYALVWKPSPAFFEKARGLRAVFALGAGVDALLPAVPHTIPLIRLDDAGMAAQMARYVVRAIEAARPSPATGDAWATAKVAYAAADGRETVGILGLGVLGAHVAETLVRLGYETHGWSRTPKSVAGVITHAGDAGLPALLAKSRTLVNLLPLTPETENILNAALFAQLPHGAHLINVARGAHLDEPALLSALASGRLSRATLDVFRVEPLPEGHPFWKHPRITVTPHISARTRTGPSMENIVAKIRALEAGAAPATLPGFVDRGRGY